MNNGPDQVKPTPTNELYTVKIDGHVRLRIPQSGMAIETAPPISVPGLLARSAEKFANSTALCYKRNGSWCAISYSEYYELVRTCAKGFLKLGLERHHSVCILGFNSPEWFISDLAAIFAGGVVVGVYTTNSPEACFHCAESSQANIIVVQDEKQLEKIQSVRSRLPLLKAVVQYEGEPKSSDVISWERLMEIGKEESDERLENVMHTICINECSTLVYTSGTVGKPKAVMLSHDNLTWDALAISERLQLNQGCEVVVSYLPLSHVAAQIVDIFITMTVGAAVYFADKDALKGTLLKTLLEVRPTRFLGVPRVWEKIYEKMQEVAAQSSPLRKTIASWAKSHALQHHLNRINGIDSKSWGYLLASSLIFKRIKQALGFDRCIIFVTAAAPLSADIKKYFMSIDLPIMEAFGMSEASGAHTICTNEFFGLETIGVTIPGMKTKVVDADESGQGEICMYGRNIFMGYVRDEERTVEALDSLGWLHSGDLGKVDDNGFVYITGRLKELLITAGGENVPPVPIEQAVQSELPCISHAFLVGDKRKFLSVLLSLKTEVDSDSGEPTYCLTREVQRWLEGVGCAAKTVTEVMEGGPDPKLLDALQKGIERANERAVSNAQRIQKFALLPADFSIATGELGPTLKIRRNVVAAKYERIIEKLYSS